MCLDAAARVMHAFPTRRSSDLRWSSGEVAMVAPPGMGRGRETWPRSCSSEAYSRSTSSRSARPSSRPSANDRRSEEHTSELQSRFDLVCRLLLEKKYHTQNLLL